MSRLRNILETWFEKFADAIYNNRLKALLIMIILTGALVSQISELTFDTSTQGLLREDDPYLIDYENFRSQFGRDQLVIILVNAPNVFDIGFLQKLKKFHDDLEENVPFLEDIDSLINARNTWGKENELVVEDLLDPLPETNDELEALKQRVLENPMFKNLLISADGKSTAIVIKTQGYSSDDTDIDVLEEFSNNEAEDSMGQMNENNSSKHFLSEEENTKMAKTVCSIAERHNGPDFNTYVAGTAILESSLKMAMIKDMGKFMNLALITIAIFLFIMFRRISGILLPLLVVILSLVSTFCIMAISGISLKPPSQILPSFILAVGVGDSVHILVIFFHHFNKNSNKKEAICYALGHSGLAVFMTSLTTAAGLLSFSTATISAVGELGIFAACGVMIAFVYTVVLLPALLSIIPLKPAKKRISGTNRTFIDRLLDFVGSLSTMYPYKVLFISAIVIIISIAGISKISFSHNPMKWFPEKNPIRIAGEKLDKELRGSTNLEIIIDTEKENGLHDPDLLNRLDESAEFIKKFESDEVYVGKVWSLTTILKEINKALNENRQEFYTIPQDRKLIAQEFLLFENSGSDDLENVTDSTFSKARLTAKVPFVNSIAYTEFIKTVSSHLKSKYPDVKVTITGMSPLMVRVVTSVIFSMAKSYGYAMVIITILMILLIGRFRIGLLSMIPNIAPILVMLGIMGWLDIKMDMFSMMVGSIAIGLAVDDTVHFMHNFRRYFEESGDAKLAVMNTLHTTGRAMLVTTCVLSIGFFMFMFAYMNNLFYFGMLTGITIIMALLSDYFIAPALMVIVNRGGVKKQLFHTV
jgi:predicted RND superfamily exporter protein